MSWAGCAFAATTASLALFLGKEHLSPSGGLVCLGLALVPFFPIFALTRTHKISKIFKS
jgi:hypothetical protein